MDQFFKMIEYRKELKLAFSDLELEDFKTFYNFELKKLFKTREITSWYFDTNNFKLYNDSFDTDVDKFKFRYRTYSNDNVLYKEIKENTQLGKYKQIEKTLFRDISEIKHVTHKGLMLSPCLKIVYTRNYYEYKNVRITIDNNIIFENTKNRSKHLSRFFLDKNIVEFKILNVKDTEIEKNIPLNTISFSKYSFGVKKIYNL